MPSPQKKPSIYIVNQLYQQIEQANKLLAEIDDYLRNLHASKY